MLSFPGYSQYSIRGVALDYRERYELVGCPVIAYPANVDLTMENQEIGCLNKDKQLTGLVTNMNGGFELNNVPLKKVNLLFSAIGYEKMIIENIPLKRSKTVDIGNIYLLNAAIVFGMNGYLEGVIANKSRKISTTVSLDYPPRRKKIKVRVEKDFIYIDYKELSHSR